MNFLSNRPVKDAAVFQPTTINNKSALQNNKPTLFMRWILALFMLCTTGAYAQMSTAVTMSASPIVGSPFASLGAAITAINGLTITGPVVATSIAGNEFSPAGGYSITATGTVTNTITFQGNGSANSIITAPSPAGTSGALNDAIFKIIGGDYITITGYQMLENAANTTTPAASNNMVEFGVALFYATTTNGAQNNTISNNIIDLNRTYQNTFGIYSNSTHSATSITTSATATTAAGGNSGLTITGNSITDINFGIVVVGPTAAADNNDGLTIGGSAPNANSITNYGTTNVFSGYLNVSGTVNGVLVRNTKNFNISFNTITSSNGGTTAGTLRGIYVPAFTNAPTGTNTNSINSNTLSLTHGVSTTLQGIVVEATTGNATSSLSISSNNFTAFTSSVASSGTFTVISDVMPNLTTNINSNTFTNITTNTTGSFTFIGHSYSIPAGGSNSINNNSIVTAFNKTGAGGTVTISTTNGSSGNTAVFNQTGNNFSNITVTGATAITGFNNTDGAGTSPIKTVTGNTFNSWTGGTSAILCMNYTYIGGATTAISSNTLTNITGQAAITGISIGSSFGGIGILNLASNTISSLTSSGTGGTVIGITCSNTSTTININNNTVSGLSSTTSAQGIAVSGATNNNVFKNTICNLVGNSAGSTVTGLFIGAGTTINVSNNRVADLRTPVASSISQIITGIQITTSTASSTANVNYNTVHLNATSSGAQFSTSAFTVSMASTSTLNARNNIWSNLSTATGPGFSYAYRGIGLNMRNTDYNDYNAQVIFTDNNVQFTTLASYQAFAAPNDANSVSVNPAFLSTTCGDANFLKINTAIATQLESGGTPVSITDDFEGDARNGSTPDIGADEFAGTPAAVCNSTPAASTILGASAVCSGLGTTLSLSTTYTDLGISYQWQSSTTPGGPYTNLGNGQTQATGPLTVTTYYIAIITCDNGGGPSTTPEKTVSVNALPTVTVSPTSSSICQPGGSAVALTASGAVSYTWSPTTGLTPTTGSPVSANPTGTTTYTVTGTDGNGCVNTATTTITVASAISVTATATPAAVCSNTNSQLNAVATALGGAGIKITEVTLNRTGTGATSPYPAFAAGADLVEISNITGSPIDISGFTLSDYLSNTATSNHTTLTFPGGTIIPANSVAVVCLGTGTNDLANRYFNTGGTSDAYSSGALMGVVLKNAGAVVDAVGLNSGYVFNAGTGVTASDWSGFAPSASGFAGAIRSGANDTNAGADWTQSSAGTPQTIGTYNGGYSNPVTIASYAWSPSTFIAGQESLQNPVATGVTATTTYTVTVTTTAGCTATGTVTVTVDPLSCSPATFTSPNCAGSNFTVTANFTGGGAPFNYSWSDGVGGVYPNAQTITANLAAGTYNFSATVTDDCGGSCTSNVTVTVNALPNVVVTPSTGLICIPGGSPVSLTASGASTYTWLPTAGLTPTTGATVSANPTSTTTYTATGTDANGCVSTGTATITIANAITSPTASATPNPVCDGAQLNLTSSASLTGYSMNGNSGVAFNDISGSGVSVGTLGDDTEHNITIPSFTFNGVAYTTARVGNNGLIVFGSTTGEIVFGNLALPSTANSAGNIFLAPWWDDLDIQLGATCVTETVGNLHIIQFTNSTHDDLPGGSITFQVQLDLVTGEIHFVYSDVSLGAPAYDGGTEATIGIQYSSTSASQYSHLTNSLVDGQSITFTPSTISYSWAGPDGFTSNVQNPVIPAVSPLSAGTYTVTFTSGAGCTNTATTAAVVVNPNYTITASAGPNGSISPNAVTTLSCDGTGDQTYTITPDGGYNVADVLVDGVSVGAVTTYTFTNVTANHTISASFVTAGFVITSSAGANGAISPNGATTVPSGGNQAYTITPDACYAIADVIVDGVSQGPVGTYTFTNVTATHTISATFVQITYTITVTAGANGSITPSTGSVNCGDNATYTITANACYSIADVVVDGISQGAVGTYTFTNVTGNHTISASFVLTTYTITVTAGANGSITPSTGSVNCGDNATYTITPNACYAIADVIVDGVSQGPIGTYTFTNVQANHTISASFALVTYTITVTAGANGAITPATGSVNCGDNATYTITPDACYSIADVVVDGVSQGAVGTYTFTNVTANHTISASFALDNYTITVTAGANGSITPSTGSVNCGDNATYTITPNTCYTIADVVVDGVSQGAVGTYTFTNVTANHTISASFALDSYTITVTAGANGSITPSTGSVNCGDNATYTITPNACYSIADVIVDGISQGPIGTHTFNNVSMNHTISATFVLTTYTITVTAGANGLIAPGSGSVNCGDNATYNILPNACYAIADVVVDGVSQGVISAYTFTNVQANHTISASFVLKTYTITVTAGANGSITPGTGSVNCGSNATYTITADPCYSIADVIVDGVSQGAVGTYTFTNVTVSHSISATFVSTTYTITVTAGANGSITPGTGSVNCGDNATYTITPDACYAIADVVVDGVSQGPVGTYTFTNVTANHTISATFVQNTFTITVTAGANGFITPPTGSVSCGANATYNILPNACYAIADVIVDGVSQGPVGTYTFTNVTANHTISATFVLKTYTITVTAGANGSITPGTGSVNCGTNATYTITADPGYAIADVIVDGVSQGAIGSYTFTNVQVSHSISASFVVTGGTFTITSSAGAGGTISPNGNTVLNAGDNQTYIITANNCFSIADVLVDGVSQGAIPSYTFTNVQAGHVISASFTQNGPYTITVTAGPNGTITPGTGAVNCGDNASYSITPNACYHVVDVLVDGVSQGAITAYTFNNVQAGHTLSATFAINPALLAPVVSGPVNVCQYIGTGDPVVYTFNSAGATGYSYVLPPNVTLVSSTANSITLNFLAGFALQGNKQIRVTALSPCGNSPMTIYYLAAQTPITPQPITASSSNICAVIGTAGTITYTINAVAGASSYAWTNPAGTTIGHPNGPGINDTTVTLSFSNAFTSSTITVQAANGCGTSNARSFTITRSNPPTPALISGPTNACPHMAPGGVAATYSVAPVAVASSYTWTAPAGAIVTHPNGAGANDYTITVLYPVGFTSGTITVSATNGCGTSGIRSLSITKLNPATPGVIDVIQTAFCGDPGGRVYTYTLASMPANATSVTWTVPAVGATITSGQGTTSLTVTYHDGAVSGTVTAKGVNNCGVSSIRSTNVSLPACPEDKTLFTKGNIPAPSLQVNVFPNPTVSDFKLQVITAGSEPVKVRILDMQGRTYKTLTVLPYQATNIGSDLKAGSYMLEVRQGGELKTMKLLKF